MIILDTALTKREAKGNHVQVGVVGAGYMGQGIVLQIEKYVEGIRIAGIANRTVSKAQKVFQDAGLDPLTANNASDVEGAIINGKSVITDDSFLLCQVEGMWNSAQTWL